MSARRGPATELLERKLLTVLFCDLVGSTALGERLDPETLRNVLKTYFDRMAGSAKIFGGTVAKYIGDAVVAVFGVPQVHEDDAERAVRCALHMRDAVGELNEVLRVKFGVELSVRIGINSGEAVTGADDAAQALATGDVMNTAARLEQAAAPGEVLVGRETMALTQAVVGYAEPRTIEAKGKAQRVEAWPVSGLLAVRRRRRAPLVGRDRELACLQVAFQGAMQERIPQVVAVLGEPGIGKSRLMEEFAEGIQGRAALYRGTCLPYGQGSAWLPLVQAIREGEGVPGSDSAEEALRKLRQGIRRRHPADESAVIEAQLGALLGATHGGTGTGPEILWAVRRYLEGLAMETPLVLLFDDLQWAEPTLAEMLQELVETIAPVPLLLMCIGRKELREQIGDILAGARTLLVVLDALSDQHVQTLISNLADALGASWTDEEERSIADRANGNPLFIEEIATIAADQGVRAGLPRTLTALIAARLDLLPDEARRVVQAGAVMGDVFWDSPVSEILRGSTDSSVNLPSVLRTLRTRGLVEEEASSFVGLRQFRFHHALIREVAYGSVPKRDRVAMHRQTAGWLERWVEGRRQLSMPIAHHYDRAFVLWEEIAPLEPPALGAVEAAVRGLLRAGEWARSHAALPESIRLLRRAVELSATVGSLNELARSRLALTLALAGEIDEAVAVAESVMRRDAAPEAAAVASQALAETARERGGTEEIRKHASRAIELARACRAGDIEAQALDYLALVDYWTGDYLGAEEKWSQAVEMALQRGDLVLAGRAAGWRTMTATFRTDMHAGQERLPDAMRIATASGSMRALMAAHMAASRVKQLEGRMEEAIEHGKERLRLSVQAGERFEGLMALVFSIFEPLFRLERFDEAWAALEQAKAISDRIGGSTFETNLHLERARILTAWGRLDEADRELSAGIGSAPPQEEGMFFFNYWARALLKLRAAQGRDQEVEAIWTEYQRRCAARPTPDTGWAAAELHLAFAGFLLDRNRVEEARSLAARVASWVAGTGAELVEEQVRDLQKRLAATPAGQQ